MTNEEREELIKKITQNISSACGYRMTPQRKGIVRFYSLIALAVAEPVIREQCANDALKRCFFCPADVAAAIREGGKG
jgi:hypothetical protein